MNMTPGKFLGYTTSTIFIVVILGTLVVALQHLPTEFFVIYGAVLAGCCGLLIPIFLGLKLYAMYRIDTSDSPKKRVSASRAVRK